MFENSGRYSAAVGPSNAIPKLPFTKTGRLGGSNQDLAEEEEEDADVMREVVTSVRSSTTTGTTGGGGSMSRYSSK